MNYAVLKVALTLGESRLPWHAYELVWRSALLCDEVRGDSRYVKQDITARTLNDVILLVNQNFPRKCRPCVMFLKPIRVALILLACNSGRTVQARLSRTVIPNIKSGILLSSLNFPYDENKSGIIKPRLLGVSSGHFKFTLFPLTAQYVQSLIRVRNFIT